MKQLIALILALSAQAASTPGTYLGQVQPRSSVQVKASSWGLNYFGYAPEYPESQLLDMASRLGVKWIRLSADWGALERVKGVYGWTHLDKLLNGALDRGMIPFVLVSESNKLYGSLPATHSEEALDAWSKYLEALVTRYKNRIKYWEIVNEPNLFWRPKPDPIQYARLLKQAGTTIRRVDPEARIIGGSLSRIDLDFAEAFLKEGAGQSFDILAFHPYNNVPEDEVDQIYALRELAHRYNPPLVLWQGECGLPSSGTSIDFRGTSPWGAAIQAKFLLRRFLTDLLSGVQMSSYFMLTETVRGPQPPRKPKIVWPEEARAMLGDPPNGKATGVNTKGLIEHGTWRPKPAYFAFQNIAAVIDGRYRLADYKVEYKVVDRSIFSGIEGDDRRFPLLPVFAKMMSTDNRPLLAYWLPWQMQEMVRPATISLKVEAQWKKPVLVDLLDGKVYALKNTDRIPLADYPFVICERSDIQIAHK